jgi:hypothetical protein
MARHLIGRTVRRLRIERGLSQQALAAKLGISASYLNLIEHDQRAVTANILLKLATFLEVDLAALSGNAERQAETQLREVFADPLLGAEPVPDEDIAALATSAPAAARAVLALYRAWRVARDESGGLALPSGRRILLPTEEVRDFFNERTNFFEPLERAAEILTAELAARPSETNHAIAERLRGRHGLSILVAPLDGARRRYDPETRRLTLAETLPRESRGFHLAFQLALLESRDAVEHVIEVAGPSSTEAAQLLRIGLLNYVAAAVLMPYTPFHAAATALRHDVEALAARFGVSFEQACQRLSSLQRPNQRGLPFFFLRVDPAGNVTKRFSAAGFPFARFGGSCPRWVVHSALATPGTTRVQVAQLQDGTTFLCFARAVIGTGTPHGEPPPVRIIAMGCDIAYAPQIVYADGIDTTRAAIGIGLSCRLCDRPDCHSRAFPPLEHRLALDPMQTGASPFRFERR